MYNQFQVDELVGFFLSGESREMLDPILDGCVAEYNSNLDEDAEIDPILIGGGGKMAEPEMDHLSNIIKTFNDQFGNIDWKDADKIREVITEELPVKVSRDKAYQNAMKQDDKQNARIEHGKALERVIVEMLTDRTELFKQFMDNPSFKKWLADTIFNETYKKKSA